MRRSPRGRQARAAGAWLQSTSRCSRVAGSLVVGDSSRALALPAPAEAAEESLAKD